MALRVKPTPTLFSTNILGAAAAVAKSNGQSGLADEVSLWKTAIQVHVHATHTING